VPFRPRSSTPVLPLGPRTAGGGILGRLIGVLLGLIASLPTPAPAAARPESPPRTVSPTDCAPGPADFTLISWLNGWADGTPREPALLAIQTGHYQAVFDPFHANVLRFGQIRGNQVEPSGNLPGAPASSFPPPNIAPPRVTEPAPASGWILSRRDTDGTGRRGPTTGGTDYLEAATATSSGSGRDPLAKLSPASLELTVDLDGTRYRCVRAATNRTDWMNFPVRIIESGRYVQRLDILQLVFEDDAGRVLEAEGRLEVVAWPDRLSLILEIARTASATPAPVPGSASASALTPSMRFQAGEKLRVESIALPVRPEAEGRTLVSARLDLPAGSGSSASDSVPANATASVSVTATTRDSGAETVLSTTYDPDRAWHRIELPRRGFSVAEQPDRLDRFRLSFTNNSASEQVVRMLFDDPSGTSSITGLTPLLRDADGVPTGIAVQTSKNWHRQEKRRLLYEGPWLHAFTMLRLPPHSRTEAEFALAFARWGGLPAASHAQLSLIGWGWNQVWDQAAIGSWGESICYEPDAIQQRCRIDDVRPLMVWGMGEGKRQWTWTHNVGGGDFLVYFDAAGTYQPWIGVRTAYLSQGPNLTDVSYTGVTADGHIACRVRVSTPRSDDIHRAYHRIRYDVLKPTPFSRLAFYQVGSDRYHWHQYGRLARGNAHGFIEEWEPGRGGRRYLRTGIPCLGDSPWFSLHEAIPADGLKPVQGAWATRGLVIRSWKARLGGRPAEPFASVFGTQAGNVPSANLELSPPPDLTTLMPGDFVEADLELVILPMSADDYYGPNANLRTSLKEEANTWKSVFRQARGNRVEVTTKSGRGRVLAMNPPVIEVNGRQRAEISVTGGLGFVPVTFAGLKSHRGWVLKVENAQGRLEPLDQSVHGHDFWQAQHDAGSDTWRLTFNVPLDSPRDQRLTRRMVLER
jgi:hypothetical protein